MDGVKILPALNKRYQEIPFDGGVSDKREVVINLIEIVAAIKRKISDEPMKIVDFYKTSEFSISREQVASIDWVSDVREHPFSAHIEFANIVDKRNFLAGTFIFDLNYRPSDAPFSLEGCENLCEKEFLNKIGEISQSIIGSDFNFLGKKTLRITDARISNAPKELMENWNTFYVAFSWEIAFDWKSKEIRKTISDVRASVYNLFKRSISEVSYDDAKESMILSREDFLVPLNYLDLMKPVLYNIYGEDFGSGGEDQLYIREAILDSSILLFSIFAIKRAEIRNQPGRKGVFARTSYGRDVSNISSIIVPRVSGELPCGIHGKTNINIDVKPFDGFISTYKEIGFNSFEAYVDFVRGVLEQLPSVYLFEDENITIKVSDFSVVGRGSAPFSLSVSEDVRSKTGARIHITVNWEATYKSADAG